MMDLDAIEEGYTCLDDDPDHEHHVDSCGHDEGVIEVCRELRKLREENRWIPVTERLPEEDTIVITFDGLGLDTCYFKRCSNGMPDFVSCSDDCSIEDITHWYELPDVPAPPEVK